MPTQLLIYENVTTISRDTHADFCVDTGNLNYEFAKGVNSVPLTAIEMPLAAQEYSIVFAGSDEVVAPFVVLGIEGNENGYLAADGSWNAKYVPAFVRRYPFVFAESEDKKKFTLCVDESWAGCNREGRGERLFDDDGERTPYLDKVMKFLEDYQNRFQRTQVYCNKLVELNLLESMKADVTYGGGEKRSLTGFRVVNREKLKDLTAEQIKDLAKTDELELTYLHLQSMNNFTKMLERANERRARADVDTNAEQ
jgi:hypothetical protein